LDGIVGVTSGTNFGGNGSSPSGLNDGTNGGDYEDLGLPALVGAAWPGTGSTIEFDLGVGTGDGYDITEIQSISAWQDLGLSNQNYNVLVKYLGDPGFSALTTVTYQPFNSGGGSNKVNVTDDDTGILASGIEAIKFDFLATAGHSAGSVYREIDVFGIETVPGPPVPPLELIVDRATGLITMDNIHVDAADEEIDFYQITSAAGALDTVGWNSFSDQNLDPFEDLGGATLGAGNDPGETWDEGGSVSANILGEAFLLSSSVIELGTNETLGNAYAGTELADEDLVFQYALGIGALVDGTVTYIGEYGTDPGDFNGDTHVDGLDLGILLGNWGQDVPCEDGNLNEEDNVDGLDLGILLGAWAPAPPLEAASVPEPTTAALALAALCLAMSRRRIAAR
jgi:hypothetical protein